jgi:CubicO group peptidase (beta-lactamase class C family)
MKKLTARLAFALFAFALLPWTTFAHPANRPLTAQTPNQLAPVAAIAAQPSIASHINSFLNRLAKQNLFMGSVLVADKSGVVMDKGYGFSNTAQRLPNTQATKFRLADTTLQFTAMAVMQLKEAGKLSEQDRACAYLTACPAPWKDVTIHQLLNQTSGIPSLYNDAVSGFYDWKYRTPEQIIGLVKDTPLLFKPGTNWHYSQINYIALGLIVAQASGQSFAAYLKNHIFQPLGMARSGLAQKGVKVPGLARGYDGCCQVTESQFDPFWTYAAGDAYSTVNDLYRWDQALGTHKLMSTKSLDTMFTPSFIFSKTAGYAYGSEVDSYSGHRLVSGSGGMPGSSSINAVFPDDSVTIIVLANNDQTAMDVIFPYIADAVLGTNVSQQPAN